MKVAKNNKLNGFTIIEVVLVLAITGLMAVSAMIGVRGAINNQRYGDSVNSFRDFLRNQYNGVNNTDIAFRDTSIEDYCGHHIQRGRSLKCLVLGRLLRIEHDHVSVYDVIGNEDSLVSVSNDEEYFASGVVNLRAVGAVNATVDIVSNPTPKEVYRLDWDAKIKHPNGSNEPSKYVLIVRSPISGSVRTYAMEKETAPTRDGLDQVLLDLVKPENNAIKHQSEFCIHPEGFAFTNRRAVVIKPNGSNASAVEIAPLDMEVNGVKAVKCK